MREMRQRLRGVDPTLPLYSECTLQMSVDGMLANRRGVMLLLGAFALNSGNEIPLPEPAYVQQIRLSGISGVPPRRLAYARPHTGLKPRC